ncbi:MAG: EAL domain-containing protein [Pseudomonadota bacterium]
MANLSTRSKVIITAILVIAVFHLAYSVFWVTRTLDSAKQTFDGQISLAVDFAVPTLSTALVKRDHRRADEAIRGLAGLQSYRFAAVRVDQSLFLNHRRYDAWHSEWREKALSMKAGSIIEKPEMRFVAKNLTTASGDIIGTLVLGFSKEAINAQHQDGIQQAVAFGAAYLAVIAFVLFALLNHLMGPLQQVVRDVHRFRRGAVDPGATPGRPCDEDGHDEIAALSNAVKLLHQAHSDARTDELTELPNRRALDDQLARLRPDEYTIALIDLDDFKPINDNFGHRAGDQALVEIANRLTAFVDDDTVVLRKGGDEFVIIRDGHFTRDTIHNWAERVATSICSPISLGNTKVIVGVSIGVARSCDVDGDAHDTLSAADAAMYCAKENAATQVELHDANRVRRTFSLQDRRMIESALERSEIRPYYQPQVCLTSGKRRGFEALARWHHPEQGVLSPAAFLPMVNELQLQRSFDIAMLRQVAAFADTLRIKGARPHRFSVNLAEETLATIDGIEELLNVFSEFPQCRDWITLEITEDVFTIRSADAIRDGLKTLFDKGLRISMDDFGTGYGSFRHLQDYKFHEMKIDRCFIEKIGVDQSSEVIIKGFVSVAEGLGADVVAEGVETAEQADFLDAIDCKTAQGYLFGIPLPQGVTEEAILFDESSREETKKDLAEDLSIRRKSAS